MACQVAIGKVQGYQNSSGDLIKIRVIGTATNCDIVDVQVTCGDAKVNGTGKVTDGVWEVSLTSVTSFAPILPCKCGQDIVVVAECQGGQCHDHMGPIPLDCISPSRCPDAFPDVDFIDPQTKCDPGGNRIVTGKVVVAPTAGNPVGVTVRVDGAVVASHPSSSIP